MFAAAHKAAKTIIENERSLDKELSTGKLESLPEKYTLTQLHTSLAKSDETQENNLINILVLHSCLHHSNGLSRESGDSTYITQLLLWLSKAILPDSSIVSQEQKTSSARAEARQIARQTGTAGLSTLSNLLSLLPSPPPTLPPDIFLSFVAFSSARDPWTTDISLRTANSLLSKYEHRIKTSAFIIDHVLQTFIRPIFLRGKRPEAITASGRKAMASSAPPRPFEASDLDEKSRPWMFEVPYTVAVFEWAVCNSSPSIATSNFSLFIPPLLTILDTTLTPTRSRALSLLSTFLPLLTPKLLTQTGLGSVFEDAITPTLMFLPNITPVEESVQLLGPAYEALIILGSVLYAGDGNGAEIKFWDDVMRKGVLAGYAHSSDHPAIVEVLVREMGRVVEKMGVNAVKHLKDVIPILSTTLTDPFSPSHPSLLLTAIKTLQTTLLNCWPRISEPRYWVGITGALVLCWTNISRATNRDTELEAVKRELIVAGKMLVSAVDPIDMRKELERLFAADDGLRQVFGLERA